MKVPPKRKGNVPLTTAVVFPVSALNESPSEKEGKLLMCSPCKEAAQPSMKVPPKRKGNGASLIGCSPSAEPSMKVPPKRKGNYIQISAFLLNCISLNESPSEKEGK